ncbi:MULTISPECIES: hypothetical protein [unclassified Clostridium]|uniref:hypothetical protein n=1 Tax=unclassified Clostridium TaxID=2614128 RepID=UPI0002979D65|nr:MULTISPECIES: hypothetical protein [unclassified Clostridium]EKQ56369.1 MAG: hypothetical protein A370_02125 [Clostridium sp. Maddingley MBC34-26]
MSLIYTGNSLAKCLEIASKELNIEKEDLKYKITKEKHSLINNKIEIEVEELQLDSLNSKECSHSFMDIDKNYIRDEVNEDCNINKIISQIGARVENGEIIVIENENEAITIKPSENIKLYINGELCTEKRPYRVTQYDEITYESKNTEAVKSALVTISDDKMEAYLCIEYVPEYIYKLKDKPPHRNLALKTIKVQGEYP